MAKGQAVLVILTASPLWHPSLDVFLQLSTHLANRYDRASHRLVDTRLPWGEPMSSFHYGPLAKTILATCFALPFFHDIRAQDAADKQQQVDSAGEIVLPEKALRQFGTDRFVLKNLREIAISPSGDRICSISPAHRPESGLEIILWNSDTGERLIRRLQRNKMRPDSTGYGLRLVHSLPVANCVLVPGDDGKAIAVNWQSGEVEWEIDTGHGEPITSLDANPDETLFALGSKSRIVVCRRDGNVVFELVHLEKNSPRPLRQLNDRLNFSRDVSYGRFSPDGSRLAIVNSRDLALIQIVDVKTWETSCEITSPANVVRMEFSPDSKSLVTTERDVAARCYDVDSGARKWEQVFSPPGQDERYTSAIAWHPDGKSIAVGTAIGEDNRIQILDSQNGQVIGELAGHSGKSWSLQFDATGSKLFSAGWDNAIRRWDMSNYQEIEQQGHERATGACAISPDGSTVVWADDGGRNHVENILSGEANHSFRIENTRFNQFQFSPDGTLLAGAGTDAENIVAYVWDVSDWNVRHEWKWPKGPLAHSLPQMVRFSGNGQRIVVPVPFQSRARVFDLFGGEQICELRHQAVFGAALSSDGEHCVTGGWDMTLRIWNCDSGEVVSESVVIGGRDTKVFDVLFFADDTNVLSLAHDGKLRIHDAKLTEVSSFVLDINPTSAIIAVSADGSRCATSLVLGAISLVDLESGVINRLAGHGKFASSLAFTADGKLLLSGAEDDRCLLWRIED